MLEMKLQNLNQIEVPPILLVQMSQILNLILNSRERPVSMVQLNQMIQIQINCLWASLSSMSQQLVLILVTIDQNHC
jgi:hypothetical protein